ncbi:hypothetical protein K0M31_003477 [Melipona bicolor]|uniref:Uncharacterized protein n=1 Tax=Melipona bicolor TaxID=60889 RepID=A0AA40FYU9_9HYME|nr:hypothetical protein K0M31_003477 [Melipona bicolor]
MLHPFFVLSKYLIDPPPETFGIIATIRPNLSGTFKTIIKIGPNFHSSNNTLASPLYPFLEVDGDFNQRRNTEGMEILETEFASYLS